MKETFYFSHDYNSRHDPKLAKLRVKESQAGKGIYWDIIEMLYEQGGYLLLDDIEVYAELTFCTVEQFSRIISDYKLFQKDEKKFWSESVLRRLKERQDFVKKQQENGAKGGRPKKPNETQLKPNLNPNETQKNPEKEIKEKEIKEKEIKEKEIKEKEIKEKENTKYDVLNLKDFLNDLHPHIMKWVNYMRDIHNFDVHQKRLETFYSKLMEYSGGNIEISKEMIDTAIKGNYKNIFELNNNRRNRNGTIPNEQRERMRKFLNEIAEL